MESKQELWVMNLAKADVSLSDLGVKVPIGKTVNVYKVNPHLTIEQVQKSLRDGALFKRLSGTNPVLRVVKKDTKARPKALDRLKQSNDPIKIKKTKSSVVIESKSDDSLEGEEFDFADYGVNDLGKDVSRVKDQSSVFVKAKEDVVSAKETSDVVTVPKVDTNISKQPTVVMETMTKNLVNPVGKLAETSTKNQPYIVTKPPSQVKEKVEKLKTKTKVAKENGTVMVGVTKDSIEKTNVVRRTEKDGEAKITMEKTEFDVRVATKTEEGHVVMELKEVAKVEKEKQSKKK